jgi:hypothetical protein
MAATAHSRTIASATRPAIAVVAVGERIDLYVQNGPRGCEPVVLMEIVYSGREYYIESWELVGRDTNTY